MRILEQFWHSFLSLLHENNGRLRLILPTLKGLLPVLTLERNQICTMFHYNCIARISYPNVYMLPKPFEAPQFHGHRVCSPTKGVKKKKRRRRSSPGPLSVVVSSQIEGIQFSLHALPVDHGPRFQHAELAGEGSVLLLQVCNRWNPRDDGIDHTGG